MDNSKLIILMFIMLTNISIVLAAETVLASKTQVDYTSNTFFDSSGNKLAMVFPVVLFIIALIFTLIDFGAIGIIIACLGGIAISTWMGLIPLGATSVVSFALLCGLLLFKVQA